MTLPNIFEHYTGGDLQGASVGSRTPQICEGVYLDNFLYVPLNHVPYTKDEPGKLCAANGHDGYVKAITIPMGSKRTK